MRRQNENYNRYLLSDWRPENPAFREIKGTYRQKKFMDFSKLFATGILYPEISGLSYTSQRGALP